MLFEYWLEEKGAAEIHGKHRWFGSGTGVAKQLADAPPRRVFPTACSACATAKFFEGQNGGPGFYLKKRPARKLMGLTNSRLSPPYKHFFNVKVFGPGLDR